MFLFSTYLILQYQISVTDTFILSLFSPQL